MSFDSDSLENMVGDLFSDFFGVIIDVAGAFFWTIADLDFLEENMPYLIVLIILIGGFIVHKKQSRFW